ncbi:uncharacterized protein PSFLO_04743 [Pseudozyma flocculosa]|uniref:Uncharacterized protein n=1 Tax=Pseudozyma flocculosa TaxID=84751 RepID=A0A5C3F433_9BASI|nr:uncharacterized protein PSFLO_04743 [Pseudozyma flocculosa]
MNDDDDDDEEKDDDDDGGGYLRQRADRRWSPNAAHMGSLGVIARVPLPASVGCRLHACGSTFADGSTSDVRSLPVPSASCLVDGKQQTHERQAGSPKWGGYGHGQASWPGLVVEVAAE